MQKNDVAAAVIFVVVVVEVVVAVDRKTMLFKISSPSISFLLMNHSQTLSSFKGESQK